MKSIPLQLSTMAVSPSVDSATSRMGSSNASEVAKKRPPTPLPPTSSAHVEVLRGADLVGGRKLVTLISQQLQRCERALLASD